MYLPGFASNLTERNKSLSEFFEIKTFELKKKVSKKDKEECDSDSDDGQDVDEEGYVSYTVPGVAASNFDAFVREVVDARKLQYDEVQVLCGLDNGQQFNKIAFLVKRKEENEMESGKSKRSEELFKAKFKDSGVKKLLLAAIVPACPENHSNQRAMLDALGMDGLEWSSTVDLKMALCLIGKSGGGLTYGCPYCTMAKPYEESEYDLLTLGDLVRLHEGYVAVGRNKKKQIDYQNCVNPNLLAGDPNTTVIKMIFPPELHLMIGVVDKHLQGLEAVLGKCWVDRFLKDENIVRKSYQGQHSLEGNQSSKFLKKLPHLEQAILKESNELVLEATPLLESLKAFSKVKDACFGQELHEEYINFIKHFSSVYRSLNNMTITPRYTLWNIILWTFLSRWERLVMGLVGILNSHLKPCTVT